VLKSFASVIFNKYSGFEYTYLSDVILKYSNYIYAKFITENLAT
jgi:hypothetical protein